MTFESFNLHPEVLSGIKAQGYTEPTPIQREAIPTVLSGKDVLGLAQTGTGKTAAFVLPILNRLIDGPRKVPRALIVAPTRELAEQIHEVIQSLGRKTNLKSITLYGGVSSVMQKQRLRQGAEILVACPGRLLDHLRQNSVSLKAIEVLVLDEADQMFDMGFLPNIRQILKYLPVNRQTLFFSATMPEDIRRLTHEVLKDPVNVKVNTDQPAMTVMHAIYPIDQGQKVNLLVKLLKQLDTESVLVFTRTKHRTKRIAEQLKHAGFKATSLQGNLSQNQRQMAMTGFRSGKYQIMVATDIAARGIDVLQISHVINFDMPSTVEAYTHRIGRTGRAARSGDAFTFVSPEDEDMVRRIERVLKSKLERRTIEGIDYSKPAPSSDRDNRGRDSRRFQQRNGGGQRGRYQGQNRDQHQQSERRFQQDSRVENNFLRNEQPRVEQVNRSQKVQNNNFADRSARGPVKPQTNRNSRNRRFSNNDNRRSNESRQGY